jgi:hypothetical protein
MHSQGPPFAFTRAGIWFNHRKEKEKKKKKKNKKKKKKKKKKTASLDDLFGVVLIFPCR